MSALEKNYSYVEFMKAVGKNSTSIQAERMLNEIYMDLFLSRIHRDQIKDRLLNLIDQALDKKDEQKFLKYSQQLNKILNVN